MLKRRLLSLCLQAVLAASVVGALAFPAIAQQTFPNRPITLVVAYAPGGSTDLMARALAQAMSPLLGQPIVVDNRSGAGGVIGTNAVASAAPDGYTIGFGTHSQLVTNPALYKLNFSVEKDLQMVGLVAKFPLVLYAGNSVPPLPKLLEMGRAEPGRIKYGSGGVGQIGHIASAMLMKEAGIDALHVPYRGSAQVLTELMAGRIDVFLDSLISGEGLVRGGQLQILAIGGSSRNALFPNVPTFIEQGLPNFDPYGWSSVFAPAKVPADILAKLNAALNTAVQSEFFMQKLREQGGQSLAPSTPSAASAYADRERGVWIPFITASGIKPD